MGSKEQEIYISDIEQLQDQAVRFIGGIEKSNGVEDAKIRLGSSFHQLKIALNCNLFNKDPFLLITYHKKRYMLYNPSFVMTINKTPQ